MVVAAELVTEAWWFQILLVILGGVLTMLGVYVGAILAFRHDRRRRRENRRDEAREEISLTVRAAAGSLAVMGYAPERVLDRADIEESFEAFATALHRHGVFLDDEEMTALAELVLLTTTLKHRTGELSDDQRVVCQVAASYYSSVAGAMADRSIGTNSALPDVPPELAQRMMQAGVLKRTTSS